METTTTRKEDAMNWRDCKGCPEDGKTVHAYGVHACRTTGLHPDLDYLTAREAHQLAASIELGDRVLDALRTAS